jgi:hypothetical protein
MNLTNGFTKKDSSHQFYTYHFLIICKVKNCLSFHWSIFEFRKSSNIHTINTTTFLLKEDLLWGSFNFVFWTAPVLFHFIPSPPGLWLGSPANVCCVLSASNVGSEGWGGGLRRHLSPIVGFTLNRSGFSCLSMFLCCMWSLIIFWAYKVDEITSFHQQFENKYTAL